MHKKNLSTIVLITASIVIAPFAILVLVFALQEYSRRLSFDPVAWKRPVDYSDDTRSRMVNDLLSRINFKGMDRKQVIDILGEPEKTSFFEGWDMVYFLGPQRSLLGFDSDWLVFRLGADEKITDYETVSD